jgi:hypothetical protein
MTMKTSILASPLLLVLAACAGSAHSSSQTQPGTGWEGDAGGDDAGDAGAAIGDDGGWNTTPTHGNDGGDACAATDPPDDQGIDSNCDGADGVIGKDVYVDAAGGQDSNEGSPSAPLRTLGAALKLATSRGGSVLVDAGTLQDSDLSAPGTWAIYGGYSTTFIGAPQRAVTTVTPSSTGLLVENATSARLAHLTVQSQAPATTSDPLSTYGLRTSAQKLALDDVDIQAAPASSGTSGAPGSPGAAGGNSSSALPWKCNGVAIPNWSIGARFASPDGVTQVGKWPSTPALQAMAGQNGNDGADATGTLTLSNGLVTSAAGTAGLGDGTPGYGGAGQTSNGATYLYGSSEIVGGYGGNGGCPGTGGKPGTNGGSSIAVLVISGHVDITRSSIGASLGGTGGDGGAGGAGGWGGWGSPPTVVSGPAVSVDSTCPDTGQHAAIGGKDRMGLGCAAYGGQAGDGGAGGHGGGGAGGWSVGVLMASDASSSIDSATTVTPSKGGEGGAGSQGLRAPSGQSHSQYTLPQ